MMREARNSGKYGEGGHPFEVFFSADTVVEVFEETGGADPEQETSEERKYRVAHRRRLNR
jgi:hypothetical protein